MCVIIAILPYLSAHAEIHTDDWDKFDGTWAEHGNFYNCQIVIEEDSGLVNMKLSFQWYDDNSDKEYGWSTCPIFAPLHSEGGDCTEIFGGPQLVKGKYMKSDESWDVYKPYFKSPNWAFIASQIRTNDNGIIIFEFETNSRPIDDTNSEKALAEHKLGLITATAEFVIYRFACALVPKSNSQMTLYPLGLCEYYYGTDQNGNYGFVGGLHDPNKNIFGINKTVLQKNN